MHLAFCRATACKVITVLIVHYLTVLSTVCRNVNDYIKMITLRCALHLNTNSSLTYLEIIRYAAAHDGHKHTRVSISRNYFFNFPLHSVSCTTARLARIEILLVILCDF